MRAVGLDFGRRLLTESDLPEPEIHHQHEVRFRIVEVGVCGTDRELSRFRFGSPPPGETFLALGHEALGEVLETGAGVTNMAKGDLVVPMIRRSCQPACACCLRRRRDLCVTGQYTERGIFGLHGYFAATAVDAAEDLLVVPQTLASVAVLAEPLSVVEKAVASALRAHPADPRTALVLGAGPIGILTAMALAARGFAVSTHSLEPPGHPRAELARRVGAYSSEREPAPADIVIEATGSPEAARSAFAWTAPNGVLVLLGANDIDLKFPGFRMVVNNLTVLGVVNAGPEHFAAAISDLQRFDPKLLHALLTRRSAREWRETILQVPPEIKSVHVC